MSTFADTILETHSLLINKLDYEIISAGKLVFIMCLYSTYIYVFLHVTLSLQSFHYPRGRNDMNVKDVEQSWHFHHTVE